MGNQLENETTGSESSWTMRKFRTMDLYPMSRILGKLKLKLNVSEIAKSINVENNEELDKSKVLEKAGMQALIQVVLQVAENAYLAQDEINDFLGSLVGISGKEFNELEIEDTFAIIALFKGQKNVSSFLKQAGTLTK